MNNDRRKKLSHFAEQLETIKEEIDRLKDEEQDYFDTMPENLQGGEKGQKAEAAVDAMDEAINSIDEAIDNINTSQE